MNLIFLEVNFIHIKEIKIQKNLNNIKKPNF